MKIQEIQQQAKNKPVVIDVHTHVGIAPKFFYQYGYPYALSYEDMYIRMEMLGIDYSVIFPFVDSAFYVNDSSASTIQTTTQYCDFPFEIENKNLVNEIYEIFPQYSHRALPFLMFDPSREAEKQVAHMEQLSEQYPVYGIKTASTYIQSFVNDLESVGKPILDFAKRKQLPIIFHSSVHPEDPWASAYDIVNLAERHPEVRICIAHSARFAEPVLEKASQLDNCFVDYSAFIIHCKLVQQNSPSIAPAASRFQANYSDASDVMLRLAKAYPDTMIWGSDTPFNYWIQKYYTASGEITEDRLECGYKEETDVLNDLPEDIKKRIAYSNNLHFIFGTKP